MSREDDEGMLFVLNDVEPENEDEFNLWYDTEHVQERASVPGFLSVRRYKGSAAGPRYCTLYRTRSLSVFESDAYRQRLAAQTDWSKRILTLFVEPNRLVGRIIKSLGDGFGAHLVVLKLPDSKEDGVLARWEAAASEIANLRGVVAVRLFEAEPRFSGPVKEYRPVLRPLVKADDRLLLVEASNAAAIEPARLQGIWSKAGAEPVRLGSYALSWGTASKAA